MRELRIRLDREAKVKGNIVYTWERSGVDLVGMWKQVEDKSLDINYDINLLVHVHGFRIAEGINRVERVVIKATMESELRPYYYMRAPGRHRLPLGIRRVMPHPEYVIFIEGIFGWDEEYIELVGMLYGPPPLSSSVEKFDDHYRNQIVRSSNGHYVSEQGSIGKAVEQKR